MNTINLTIKILFFLIFVRLVINSYLINKRDGTSFFIFFLFPLSQQKVDFMIESAIKPWWTIKENELQKSVRLKIISNITAFLIAAILVGIFIYKISVMNTS